jgi:hypothetical protein
MAAVRPSGLRASARYPSGISSVLVFSRLSRSHQVSSPSAEAVTSDSLSGVRAMFRSVQYWERNKPTKPSGSIREPIGTNVPASLIVIAAEPP